MNSTLSVTVTVIVLTYFAAAAENPTGNKESDISKKEDLVDELKRLLEGIGL